MFEIIRLTESEYRHLSDLWEKYIA